MNLSIIIPVYNVEKYLAKCLDSILVGNCFTGQVVCVNDGSTDGSAAILEDYGKKYPNVEIITQPNAGLSAARNAGIKAAKGEYVCFLDSDDYWEPNMLGKLMAQIERDKLDVLRFKYQNVNENYEVFNPNKGNPYRNDDYSESVTDGVSFLNSRFGTACYAVMFIVKRSLIYKSRTTLDAAHIEPKVLDPADLDNSCLFTEGIYFEDTDWTPRMLTKANRVASTDTTVYNYLQRKGSITNAQDNSKQKKVLEDKMRLVGELQQQIAIYQKDGKAATWFNRMIADTVISIINTLSLQFYTEKSIYIERLKQMNAFPICTTSIKSRLINMSPLLMVKLLHYKNG